MVQNYGSKGFSLASVMVGVAVVGIVALGTLSLFESMTKSQNFQETRLQVDNFTEEVRAHLSNVDSCKSTLSSVNLGASGATTDLNSIKEANGTLKNTVGSIYGNGAFVLTGLQFLYTPGDLPTALNANLGEGVLRIFTKAQKSVSGTSTLKFREIAIRITKSPTGQLIECIAMAKMTDGIWTRSTNINDIFYSTGRVGIGTSQPLSPLHVLNGISTSTAAGSPMNILQIFNEAPDTGVLNYGHTTGGTPGGKIDIRSENVTRMTILNSGDVGIGSQNPTVKLDVSGEIKVSSSGMTCTTDKEGAVRYHLPTKNLEVCDGTQWKSVQAAGEVCQWIDHAGNASLSYGGRDTHGTSPSGECPSGQVMRGAKLQDYTDNSAGGGDNAVTRTGLSIKCCR
ncbi:MAG: hypothetical protein K2Q26_14105 [Bdellovibrionales bacterium]|nr:hypothetical protein [Bdellovibrionales bacterium]